MKLSIKHLTKTVVSDNFVAIPGWEEWNSNNFSQARSIENYEGVDFVGFHFT